MARDDDVCGIDVLLVLWFCVLAGHLDLEPELQSNVSMTYYEGGHMMYADEVCLAQMTTDIEAFYAKLVGACPCYATRLVDSFLLRV